MRDVAKAAGVSQATVSRVVNDERYIRPETRAAVERAIAELGFHRNEIARTLRPGQAANTIALVIEDPGNPFWSAIIRGAEETARRHRHMLVVGSTGQDYDQERDLLRDLVRRRVDGLLVVPTAHDHVDLHHELARRAPMVFIDRVPPGVPADSVVLDSFGGARSAVAHLISAGYRRIAFLGGDPAVHTGAARQAGYRQALADAGLPCDPALISLGNHTVTAAARSAAELLTEPVDADAVFADNNRICVGVLHAAAAHGGDVGIAGFDDVELVDLLPRPVALITYDAVELGRQAATLLFDRIGGSTAEARRVVLPTKLVHRGDAAIGRGR
ncbi:LacI family transcriptional regulator [Actinoplanes sp. NBC_00393]|uniref:LacI family DNA-binding transcriptional regulator n=1 Tax=Actinoplanes sp. NBC_00393 TaxID=2975953 RepID=UPI002E1F043C